MGFKDLLKGRLSAGRSPTNFGVFRNRETDWAFRRKLENMNVGAAEIGECLYVAQRIKEKDIDSWIKEWSDLANRLEQEADDLLTKGHKISAREIYWRASNYYHAAEYGASPFHPRSYELWERGVKAFQKSCPLFNPPIQVIEVPFEGKKLGGYFWPPDNSSTECPTIFTCGGNDTTGEEVFFWVGPAAIKRGYNFFTFEYPGHRGTVHRYFPDPAFVKRLDYEVPFYAAFDYLETLPGVDERIALTGFSGGGFVTTRVAIHEKRVKAVIPNGPLIDVWSASSSMLDALDATIPMFILEKLVSFGMNKSPLMKSMAEYTMWTYGYSDVSVRNMLTVRREGRSEAEIIFNITEDLHKITCPAMALICEDEGEELLRQATEFYNRISSENKVLKILTLEKDSVTDHCQLDNRTRGNQVMFDWLDEVFNYKHEPAVDPAI